MTSYTAGWNVPGFLPESDPCTFDTAVEAIRYLSDAVERFWDDDYMACDTASERDAIDTRWIGAFSALPYQTVPFNLYAGGLVFWVDIYTEGN